MSPSDPDRPTDEQAAAPADENTTAATATDSTVETPAPADDKADATRAADAAPATAPVAPVTTSTPAVAPSAGGSAPVEPPSDTGRHAVVRPAPEPPAEVAEPKTTTFAVPARVSAREKPQTAATAATPAAAPAAAPTPPPAPGTGPVTAVVAGANAGPSTKPQPVVGEQRESTFTPAPAADGELFPDPNAPRSTSVGAHILGAIVGLLLGPAAAGTLLLGQARILEAQAPGWSASVDTVGILLVGLGLLLLGWVVVLAVWTPAVPITAGIVLSALGGVALIAPGVAREVTLRAIDSSGWHLTITQVLVAGTSGTLLTAGFLILLAGFAAAAARRRGLRLGEFRERHR